MDNRGGALRGLQHTDNPMVTLRWWRVWHDKDYIGATSYWHMPAQEVDYGAWMHYWSKATPRIAPSTLLTT